ncbi:hypothetical protein V5799_017173 [Amblyomma americanum]|uniref:Uncharacterized protein n=1 Tax=Amblyomma americanum TaxID=6943 RepID=A0AAQ4F410_AMBAM
MDDYDYKEATQAACWVLLPNLGGLAGFYIVKSKHDQVAEAMVDVSLLCGAVALLGRLYFPINQKAAKIMLPCFAWALCVATFNFRVWRWSKRRSSA